MEEKTVLVNGLKTNYKTQGAGEPILILHGWPSSSDSWIEVQKILASKGYRVLVPDLPGFGKSDSPPEPWGVEDYDNFVLELSRKLQLSRFFLFGHSFGGRVAVKFAINHPEEIKGLILCNSAGIKPEPGLKTIIIFQLARIGNTIFSPKFLRTFQDGARNIFYFFLRHRDYVKAEGVMKETMKKIIDEDLLPLLSRIKNKTLIIWGEKDRMVPLRYGYIFKEKIRGSKFEIITQAGHGPHLEVPQKLSEIVFNFLKTI